MPKTKRDLWPAIIVFGFIGVLISIWGYVALQSLIIIPRQSERELKDLEHAVPSVAYQLSAEEVEQTTGFFTKMGKFIEVEKKNPVTIEGKSIEKVSATNPNVRSVKHVILLRSAFYNSSGYALEDKTGLFASQALLFENKEDADRLEEDLKKEWGEHYKIVFRKGNIVGAINMYLSNVEPTKEFWELISLVKENGFTIIQPD